MKKILALALCLVMVLGLTACNSGVQPTSKVEPVEGKNAPQTYGNLTVFVPDSMTLSGGSASDPSDLNVLWLAPKDGAAKFFQVSILADAETAKANVDRLKETNANAEDVEVMTFGERDWTGITYQAENNPCFDLYSDNGETVVEVLCYGYGMTDAETGAILESIVAVKPVVEEAPAAAEPAK